MIDYIVKLFTPFVLRSTHTRRMEVMGKHIFELQQQNTNLLIALREAQKNDYRDPKTGRFAKRP